MSAVAEKQLEALKRRRRLPGNPFASEDHRTCSMPSPLCQSAVAGSTREEAFAGAGEEVVADLAHRCWCSGWGSAR